MYLVEDFPCLDIDDEGEMDRASREIAATGLFIAAAPDLFKALVAFVGEHDDAERDCPIFQDGMRAIAKATVHPARSGCYVGQDMIGNDPDELSDIEQSMSVRALPEPEIECPACAGTGGVGYSEGDQDDPPRMDCPGAKASESWSAR